MTKIFDFSKFRKSVTKNIETISSGFNDPQVWVSTGNFCLNYLISGSFYKGIPLSKVTCFAGESGSGKSLICSGTLVKNAQDQGIFVVLIDSENALDEKWLKNIGVDTSESKLLRFGVSMVEEVARVISDFMKYYREEYESLPLEEQPRVLFVIDSVGMLQTPSSVSQFEKGELKGDMGIKAKQLKALVSNCVNMIAPYNVGIVATNHTYASHDMYSPDDVVSGGSGVIFASSIVVLMKKKRLKEDDQGNKIVEVRGIKSSCKILKSRYAKPFESVDIFIPYDEGIQPYSGLFDFFVQAGVLKREGKQYKYITKKDGKEIKAFRKVWTANPEMYHVVMDEFDAADIITLVDENGEMLDDVVDRGDIDYDDAADEDDGGD